MNLKARSILTNSSGGKRVSDRHGAGMNRISIADELTTALMLPFRRRVDAGTAEEVGMAIIMVTHDLLLQIWR